jgi:hypothetical protein
MEKCLIWNLYGPAESTIDCTRTEVEGHLTNLQRNINRIVRSNVMNEDSEKEEIKLQTHTQ